MRLRLTARMKCSGTLSLFVVAIVHVLVLAVMVWNECNSNQGSKQVWFVKIYVWSMLGGDHNHNFSFFYLVYLLSYSSRGGRSSSRRHSLSRSPSTARQGWQSRQGWTTLMLFICSIVSCRWHKGPSNRHVGLNLLPKHHPTGFRFLVNGGKVGDREDTLLGRVG